MERWKGLAPGASPGWSFQESRLQTPDSEVTKDQMSSCGRALPINPTPPHSLMFCCSGAGSCKNPPLPSITAWGSVGREPWMTLHKGGRTFVPRFWWPHRSSPLGVAASNIQENHRHQPFKFFQSPLGSSLPAGIFPMYICPLLHGLTHNQLKLKINQMESSRKRR